jgi:hypothetical protein
MLTHNIPDSQDAGFARTHRQKIAQRIALICALRPETRSIAEHTYEIGGGAPLDPLGRRIFQDGAQQRAGSTNKDARRS